jgi:cytoskeletal protein CcmA (bactofilin family)
MWNKETAVGHEKAGQLTQVSAIGLPAPIDERRAVAWVGKSVIFKGTLISSEDITIDGQVEGTIEVRDQTLTVGPDASIRADIVARTVTIHGTIVGNIRASEKIDLRATGRIEGNLAAPSIVVADGAMVSGRVDAWVEQSDVTRTPRTTRDLPSELVLA